MADYEAVNDAWPQDIPAITRAEARSAAAKLARHFGKYKRTSYVRPCWIAATPPFNEVRRGWRRLVHDMSHYVWRRGGRKSPDHNPYHADLERQMVEYVLDKGWLTGALRPAAKPKPLASDRRERRLESARRNLSSWERRERLAHNRVIRWRRRVKAMERYAAQKEIACQGRTPQPLPLGAVVAR